jgi:hypothetical protein
MAMTKRYFSIFIISFLSTMILEGDETIVPTVEDILVGMKQSESLFFQSESFLVRVERVKCEEITPSRYSGRYLNAEFIVAKKGSSWFTSKTFTQIGKENKDGKNMAKLPDGKELLVPLKPQINILKNHLVLEWNQNSTAASVQKFTNGGNMHQCTDFFRQIGWDLSKCLIESEGENYASVKTKEAWLGDYIDHPFLPDFLEKHLSKYTLNPVQEKVDGFPCWVIEYPKMDKIWIDCEHGYIVRKRIYHWGPGQPKKFAIHNKDFREVKQGIWLPSQQIVDKYTSIISEDKKIWDKVASRLYYETKEIVIDHVPENIFDVKPEEGLQIVDSVRDTIYRISDSNSDPFAGAIAQGIKANRYVMFRAILIIIGSVLILIAVWLMFKKKKL